MQKQIGVKTLLCLAVACAMPLAAHDCHHGHDDCWDCGGNRYSGRGNCQGYQQGSRSGASTRLESFNGKVAEVVYLASDTPESATVEIRTRTEADTRLVRVGPSGFLKDHGLLLREGDTIRVTGFVVNGMEGQVFVATEVSKDGASVRLRDDRGRTAW